MTRFTRSTTIAALLAIATLAAASASMTTSAARGGGTSPLQRDLDAVVSAGAPGAILFVRDGNRITRLSAGIGDIAHKTPMRPDNHFKIASLTKSYTATVVLQLVGEGTVGLDDTVQRWLPGVVPNGGGITIRQLLNHTSGLADFEDSPRYLKPYMGGNFAYYWSPRQLVKIGVSQKPLFNPGSSWSYSNTNYVVAQLIVEKATGKSLGAELAHRIFKPLGLTDTSYPTKQGLPTPFSHGYMLLGKAPLTDVTGLSPSLAPGSGGIVSTVRDIADFYRALLGGKLLEPAQMRQLKTTVSQRTGKVVTAGPGYGLGIARGTSCSVGWGHSGELPGYDSETVFSEDGKRQAVLMINQDATTLPKRAFALAVNVLKKAFCTHS